MLFYYGRFVINIQNVFLQRLGISLVFVGILDSPNSLIFTVLTGLVYLYFLVSFFLGFMAIIAIIPKYFSRLNETTRASVLQSFGMWLKIRKDPWSLFNIFEKVTYGCIIIWSLVLQLYPLTILLVVNRAVLETIFIWQSDNFYRLVYEPIIIEYYKRQIYMTQKYLGHIFKIKEKDDADD